MEFKVRAEVLKVIVIGKLIGDLYSESHCGFVSPASGHIANGIAIEGRKTPTLGSFFLGAKSKGFF